MVFRPFVLAAVLSVLALAFPAHAASRPDYLSFGVGGYDFDKKDSNLHSADFRIEYRNGTSLLPLLSPSFNSLDKALQLHPSLGLEVTTHGAFFPNAGLNLDIPFLRHGIFTWSESAGAFARGSTDRWLGSVLEFRSQLELGWRFDNALRLTGYISHISNGGVVRDDPGAEVAGLYVHVPFSMLRKK